MEKCQLKMCKAGGRMIQDELQKIKEQAFDNNDKKLYFDTLIRLQVVGDFLVIIDELEGLNNAN